MIDLLQTLGSGVLVGLVYALLGLCIVIIFKASEAFNFAIGEFLIIGSFLFYVLFFNDTLPWHKALPLGVLIFLFLSFTLVSDKHLHLRIAIPLGFAAGTLTFFIFFSGLKLPSLIASPILRFVVALPLGLVAAGIVGAVVERFTIKPLMGRSPIAMTIVTLGLGFFFLQLVDVADDTAAFDKITRPHIFLLLPKSDQVRDPIARVWLKIFRHKTSLYLNDLPGFAASKNFLCASGLFWMTCSIASIFLHLFFA